MEQYPQPPVRRPSRFAKWSLTIGIVIVLNMLFNYAISLVYPAPVYPALAQVVAIPNTKADCVTAGGQWTEMPIAPAPQENSKITQPRSTGYCDPGYTVRMHYEAARAAHERNVFIVLTILGILSIITGVLIAADILSAAFSWGGVLSLVIASMRYWSDANNLLKVAILAIALAGLIWIALRKFGSRAEQ